MQAEKRRVKATRQWWSRLESARHLDIAQAAVDKLASGGHIRTRQLPGMWVQYCRADVEKLAREAMGVELATAG